MKKFKVNKGSITGLVIGLVMTLALFFALTFLQRWMLQDTEKTVVVLAGKKIAAGTVITELNKSEYFKEVEVSSTLATTETYKSAGELVGKYVMRNTEPNEIIYKGLIGDEAETLGQYEEPVEISLTISENAAAVAGTIRKGDYVNVYAAKMTHNGTIVYDLVLSNILVNQAYDSNTVMIKMSDTESVALTFTFYMEKADVPGYLDNMNSDDIFVVKVK